MSAWKWIVGIVVVAVVAGLVWYLGWFGATPAPAGTSAALMGTSTPASEAGMSAASDGSDAALVQDSAAIDAQMNGLDSDSAAANQTDQPVQQ